MYSGAFSLVHVFWGFQVSVSYHVFWGFQSRSCIPGLSVRFHVFRGIQSHSMYSGAFSLGPCILGLSVSCHVFWGFQSCPCILGLLSFSLMPCILGLSVSCHVFWGFQSRSCIPGLSVRFHVFRGIQSHSMYSGAFSSMSGSSLGPCILGLSVSCHVFWGFQSCAMQSQSFSPVPYVFWGCRSGTMYSRLSTLHSFRGQLGGTGILNRAQMALAFQLYVNEFQGHNIAAGRDPLQHEIKGRMILHDMIICRWRVISLRSYSLAGSGSAERPFYGATTILTLSQVSLITTLSARFQRPRIW